MNEGAEYFIDPNKPGLLRKVSDPTSGILVGIDAREVLKRLNNHYCLLEALKGLYKHSRPIDDGTDQSDILQALINASTAIAEAESK